MKYIAKDPMVDACIIGYEKTLKSGLYSAALIKITFYFPLYDTYYRFSAAKQQMHQVELKHVKATSDSSLWVWL